MTLPEKALRLVVITDRDLALPRSVVDVVEQALQGGARAVQLREKAIPVRAILDTARLLRRMTREWDALFFINDRFDVALAVEADGVHLGPHDLPVGAVRAVAPRGFLIGASTDDPDAALRLQMEGADYIGCGAVFQTSTKKDAGKVIGVEGLARVAAAVDIPVVGIGGVTPTGAVHIAQGSSAAGVAVIGAVMAATDPEETTRRLLAPFGPDPI